MKNKTIFMQNLLSSQTIGLFLVIVALFLVSAIETEAAGERPSIRSGDALSRTAVVQQVNINRTRRDAGVVVYEPTTVVVRNSNETEVTNDVSATSNTGGNSTGVGGTEPEAKTLSLRELGLLQLAAHDFFNVDRDTEVDHENGDLDLSTLLDHGDEYIAVGGEARNRENVILFSVAKIYGERYLYLLDRGNTPEQARKKLLRKYHRELGELYEYLFDEDMPEPREGAVTQTENVALRTIHDFLPGSIEVGGILMTPVDAALIGTMLSKKELKQRSDPLDGLFDPVFLDIVITIPPSTVLHISLLERDSSFATQFNTDHSFEYFMSELEDGEYGKDDLVYHHIKNLFAKGLHFE